MSSMMVGIDVSLRSHHVQFMDEEGISLGSFAISNNRLGADTLIRRIKDCAKKKASTEIRIGLEATSNLGWHLAHYLRSAFADNHLSLQVYMINARKLARFKKGYDTLPKNDQIDSWVIADHIRFGRLPHEMKDVIQYDALRRLTRTRFHIMQRIVQEKNFFLNQVFLKFPSLRQDNPFSTPFGATSLAVIQELEPEQIAAMPIEELANFLRDKGKNRFHNTEEIAAYLKKIARSTFRLDKAMADPVNLSLSSTLSILKHMEREVEKLDKEITKIVKTIPETLSSVKGIGPVFTAGIIAEIGDISKFKNHNALAKYAGFVWNQTQSGEFEADETRRMKTGNKYLRYYLTQAANCVRKHDSEYKAYYMKKYNEVPKHKHKRALVLTARKLVRLVFTLLKTKQLYIPPERRG